MTEKRKSIRALAEELKAIRKRPVPRQKIEEFNGIMEEEDRLQREDKKRQDGDKKIASRNAMVGTTKVSKATISLE